MQLSQNQIEALNAIMLWHKGNDKSFALAGFAGTGKTTLAKYIAEAIGNVVFCSYTGKAANVLREKGCTPCGTIHSYLYKFVNDDELGKPYFTINWESNLIDAALVIVDEYSMLNQEIISDLQKLSKKILYLGDPFQLPPVKGEQNIEPDFFLTEVHRQALESPILRAATAVRKGERLSYSASGDFIYGQKNALDQNLWYEVNQTIVGKNATRRKWNEVFLKNAGFKDSIGNKPSGGEKVICLKNSRERGLFNGMIGYVEDIGHDDKGNFTIDFMCDADFYGDIPVWEKIFQGYDGVIDRDIRQRYELFDYGYAITCHKSQGSEFDQVLIYNEPVGRTAEEIARWRYTAITRAAKKCILVDP